MVVINILRSTDEFLTTFPVSENVNTVTVTIARIYNLRLRMKRLIAQVKELSKYGLMKPMDKRGLSEDQLNVLGNSMAVVENADPLGIRVGVPPSTQSQQTFNTVCDEAEALLSNNNVKLRKSITLTELETTLQNIKGAVMMAYPMGLPEYDAVRMNLENDENLEGTEDSKYVLDEQTCILWFAGKQMDRQNPLSKHVGSNDKVTIKCKIEGATSGAPARESAVDEETRRKMMSYWHKKEEENKRLEAEEEDNYLNSAWANPRSFKESMHGINSIKWR